MSDNALQAMLDMLYAEMDGSNMARAYGNRHGIKSASILTVTDDERASLIASYLAERIEGKKVVEIGAGIGLLACHMGQYAKQVFAIEANPAWTHVFVAFMYLDKPKNVSFLFGSADEFEGIVSADVALFCTHSDHSGMRAVAHKFAPEVIDVYDELVGSEHEDLMLPSIRDSNRIW